ncbi:MAG: hypothetical protein ACMUIE_07255 [Thermoplasmatota archaeon]
MTARRGTIRKRKAVAKLDALIIGPQVSPSLQMMGSVNIIIGGNIPSDQKK